MSTCINKILCCRQPKISILIPFVTEDPYRQKVFNWLLKYWKKELPDAEVIVGHSHSKPFCKNEALNDAFRRSTGKVIVMMDADAYIQGKIIEKCADMILENLDNHLWFVPYRKLYRLNQEVTKYIVESNPANPFLLSCPPIPQYLDDNGDRSGYGHRFGAMCMVYPREAIEMLGCYDERFKGWGGEDVSILRALDTLYGKHKSTDNCIYHLWHPFHGDNYGKKKWELTRKWDNQDKPNSNSWLSVQYHKATGKPSEMRKLVDEGCCGISIEHYDSLWCLFPKILCMLLGIISYENIKEVVGDTIDLFKQIVYGKKEKIEAPYELTLKEVTRYHKPYHGDKEDYRMFRKEFTTKSLEQQCEDGDITGEEYDAQRIKKDLGII